jgi:carbonic anhydrase
MLNLSKDGRACKSRSFQTFLLLAAVLGLLQIALSACAAGPRTAKPPEPASGGAVHWSYQGDTGPEHWYALDPAYGIARDGRAQSPIAIDTRDLTVSDTMGKIVYHKTSFEVENNGHTIELAPVAAGNLIILDGETFALQQFHFHAPSEHLIDGRSFAMELHLVHKDSQGRLAVVGMMITQGERNETLGEIFENLPPEITGEGSVRREVEINLGELFTDLDGMYQYEGSLTTPPCTEGVKWNIATGSIEMSSSQIEAFRALYRGNNRPLQNRYGRRVYVVRGQN